MISESYSGENLVLGCWYWLVGVEKCKSSSMLQYLTVNDSVDNKLNTFRSLKE